MSNLNQKQYVMEFEQHYSKQLEHFNSVNESLRYNESDIQKHFTGISESTATKLTQVINESEIDLNQFTENEKLTKHLQVEKAWIAIDEGVKNIIAIKEGKTLIFNSEDKIWTILD